MRALLFFSLIVLLILSINLAFGFERFRSATFLEKMREPVFCEDLLDPRIIAPFELVYERLERPVGSLIIRKQDISLIQTCIQFLRDSQQGIASTIRQRCFGVGYAMGLGVGKDLSRARMHFDKAAQAGDRWSALQAAGLTWHMGLSSRDAFYLRLEAIAHKGESVAAVLLGKLFLQDSSRLDRAQAFNWYSRAAQLNDPYGICGLAVLKATSPYFERNYKVIFELMRRSATSGDPNAVGNLGLFMELGHGTSRDLPTAIRMYIDAAEAGSPSAKRNLAIAYEKGNGLPKDLSKAMALYQSAAKDGDFIAQHKLSKR